MVFRESVENEIWLGEGVCGHLSRNVKLYKSSRIRQCLISYDDTTPLDLMIDFGHNAPIIALNGDFLKACAFSGAG